MYVYGSVTARLIGSWVDHEGRRSGLEVEGPASKGMYSVRLNKHTGSENGQYLVRWGQLCAIWQRGQTARGNTFTVTPTACFYFSQCNISLAIADALKHLWGSKTPAVNPDMCVCVCTADNFVDFSLWFGHVTRPQNCLPFEYLKERGGGKTAIVITRRPYMISHGMLDNSFFFPGYYWDRHLDKRTQI